MRHRPGGQRLEQRSNPPTDQPQGNEQIASSSDRSLSGVAQVIPSCPLHKTTYTETAIVRRHRSTKLCLSTIIGTDCRPVSTLVHLLRRGRRPFRNHSFCERPLCTRRGRSRMFLERARGASRYKVTRPSRAECDHLAGAIDYTEEQHLKVPSERRAWSRPLAAA